MKTSAIVERIQDLGFAPCLLGSDGRGSVVRLSCEEGGDIIPADYYGEFHGGYPWIHAELVALADSIDHYWEWENPGVISLYLV